MSTRTPVAAIIFYTFAALVGFVGLGMIVLGFLGAVLSSSTYDRFHVGALVGGWLMLAGLVPLVYSAVIFAVGLIAHDIHRIAENTAPSVVAGRLAESMAAGRTSEPASAGPVVFYYFEKGVEHGPVSKEELAALIRSSQVNIFQRIDTSAGGIRRPFELSDLEG